MPGAERRSRMPDGGPPEATGPGSNWGSRLKTYFRKGFRDWIREFLEYRYLIASSLVLVVIATYLDYHCGVYVSSTEGPDIPDLILDHIGPVVENRPSLVRPVGGKRRRLLV